MSRERKRQVEREFGVPFAGEILDPSQWTKTALKKLPPDAPLDLPTIFGRSAPLVIDIGCGNGRFLLGSAVWRRDHDHLGIDILPVVIRYATRRANQRGLTNIRFAVVDGLQLLDRYLQPNTVAEIHCYHPQPYDDETQAPQRMLTASFLAKVHTMLIPGGMFFIQTDHRGYWKYLQDVLPHFFNFHERIGRWPDAPKGRTRREIIALKRGMPIYRGSGSARTDVTETELARLVEMLPPPLFGPDRNSAKLDALD